MRKPGVLTQCDSGGWALPDTACPNTARLAVPAVWRCEKCEREFGKLSKEQTQ